MRSIVACGLILLGLNGTAREPEYAAQIANHFTAANDKSAASPVEIDSSTGRSDRLAVTPLQPHVLALEIFRPTEADMQLRLASASTDLDAGTLAGSNLGLVEEHTNDVSVGDLCQALFSSAEANDIPVQFFANLIWQESRLNPGDVSKKGAQGIAQFMPEVAAEKGLHDPFDPLQALPASARLLRELRMQFGNLGLVAAAYNAGPNRVIQWLERHVSLPRETRNYVVRVTGLSVDDWRNMPVSGDALTFVQHLPCRSMPAFAQVEQAQQAETQVKIEQAKLEEDEDDVTGAIDDPPPPAVEQKPERKPESKAAGAHEKREGKHPQSAKREPSKREPGKHDASKRDIEHHAHEKRRA